MARSLTCTGVRRANGRVFIGFSNGETLEFTRAADVMNFVRSTLSVSDAQAMLIRAWLEADPTGQNTALIENKTLTIDFDTPASLVKIT